MFGGGALGLSGRFLFFSQRQVHEASARLDCTSRHQFQVSQVLFCVGIEKSLRTQSASLNQLRSNLWRTQNSLTVLNYFQPLNATGSLRWRLRISGGKQAFLNDYVGNVTALEVIRICSTRQFGCTWWQRMYTSPLLFYIQLSFIYSVTIAMRQEQGLSNKPSAYDVTDMGDPDGLLSATA